MRNHVALYGGVKLLRGYCYKCKSTSFIIDKKFSCCDSEEKDFSDKYKRMSQTEGKRRRPPQGIQTSILSKQENKCFYCRITFGDIYFRKKVPKISYVHFDHIIPFSYLQDNPNTNWVAACNICNLIKSSKMFSTIREVKDYVKYHRRKKEIILQEEVSIVPNDNCKC